MLSLDAIDSWSTELKEMNRGKEGHQFVYPELFMEALGYCHLYLHLPFRQTEGLIKSHLSSKQTPTYSAIWKRVNKLDIKMNPKLGKDIVIAIDSTGIKVADRGECSNDHKYLRAFVGDVSSYCRGAILFLVEERVS